MKKAKALVDKPIGIVIATGQSAQSSPKVRAYLWCDVAGTDEKDAGSRSED